MAAGVAGAARTINRRQLRPRRRLDSLLRTEITRPVSRATRAHPGIRQPTPPLRSPALLARRHRVAPAAAKAELRLAPVAVAAEEEVGQAVEVVAAGTSPRGRRICRRKNAINACNACAIAASIRPLVETARPRSVVEEQHRLARQLERRPLRRPPDQTAAQRRSTRYLVRCPASKARGAHGSTSTNS